MYNEGISVSGDLLDLGVEYGVVKKNGNSYTFGDHKLGVGREAAKKVIKEDKKLMPELRKAILAEIKSKEVESSASKK
jgi:recombination protein RecA